MNTIYPMTLTEVRMQMNRAASQTILHFLSGQGSSGLLILLMSQYLPTLNSVTREILVVSCDFDHSPSPSFRTQLDTEAFLIFILLCLL